MKVVRLPLNEYSLRQICSLARPGASANVLGRRFAAELGKPPQAVYLGVFDDAGELAGAARLVTAAYGVVLMDALEVSCARSDYEEIETALLDAADALAAEAGKTLAVIADTRNAGAWSELGFQAGQNCLLTLAPAPFEY